MLAYFDEKCSVSRSAETKALKFFGGQNKEREAPLVSLQGDAMYMLRRRSLGKDTIMLSFKIEM